MKFTTHLRSSPKERDSSEEHRTWRDASETGLSPFLVLFSKRLTPAPPLVEPLKTTIQGQVPDFHPELFPLQSPLLRESWLVSLPPLTDMLKFSG